MGEVKHQRARGASKHRFYSLRWIAEGGKGSNSNSTKSFSEATERSRVSNTIEV